MYHRVLVVLVVLVAVAGMLPPGAFAGGVSLHAEEASAVPQQLPLGDEATVYAAPAQTNAGVTAQADGLHTYVRYRELLLDERLAAAENTSAQRAVLDDEATAVKEAVTALREREESAYEAHVEGELSEQELAWRLGQTAEEAAALEQWLTTVIDTVDETPDVEFIELGTSRNELRGLQIDVTVSQTPLRDRLYQSMTGDTEAVTGVDDFRIGTTGTHVTLTAIDGDRYVTETYHPELRSEPEPVALDFAQVENRTDSLYPPFDGFNGIFVPTALGEAAWQLQLTEGYLESVAYYDEQTDAVFYERQEIDLNTVPTETVANQTDAGLTVSVEHTRPGGPAQVSVVDAETGVPVDASVSIADTDRGTTTAGSLWVIAPQTQSTVTVVTDDSEVEVSVDWTQQVAPA